MLFSKKFALLACLAFVGCAFGALASTPPVGSEITEPLPPFVGDFQPVPLSSSDVKNAANFAIKYYNSNLKVLQNKLKVQVTGIQLKNIMFARQQIVSGVNYEIECKVACKQGNKSSDMVVIFLVNSNPWKKIMTVMDLKKISTPVAPSTKPSPSPSKTGAFKPVSASSKEVKSAASFAIKHLNANVKVLQQKLASDVKSIGLVKVVSAQEQIVAGIRYKINCKVMCKSAAKSEEITVTVFVTYVPWTKTMKFNDVKKVAPITGGYTPVSLPSKAVSDAAAFGIKHLNTNVKVLQQKLATKANKIAVKAVTSAEQQIVAGVKYKINCKVSATVNGKPVEYLVELFVQSVPWQKKMAFLDLRKKK